MKTVTAKEFQLNQSSVMKEVAQGMPYQITYHGKPWVELHPSNKQDGSVRKGSVAAVRESLKIKLSSQSMPASPDYKAIRRQGLMTKFSD